MSCCVMEKLKSDLRMAEIEVKQNYSARRLFLDANTEADAKDDDLMAFIEDKIVEAEMKITRTCITLDQHRHNCHFCSPSTLN